MFNRPIRNEMNEDVEDIQNDVRQLADSLEEVLKSWGNDASDGADNARRKAKALLRETRARMYGRTRMHQAARDAMGCAGNFLRDNPWHTLGAVAAVGIFIGALVTLRR